MTPTRRMHRTNPEVDNGQTPRIFLSHNARDKSVVRRLAAAIAVTGARVWFDEWEIRPGDSIPGAIDQGLTQFNVFALAWSDAAAKSQWVRTEMDAAVTRLLNDSTLRIVPVILDRTSLPTLLASLRYVDATDGEYVRVARELLDIESDAAFRMAVQTFIDDAGLSFREFWGVGVLVACPGCGAPAEHIEGWQETDYKHDRSYIGARCTVCEWSESSEE